MLEMSIRGGFLVYRQTPRSARVRATSRRRILAAARRLFGRHGYQATTMRQIAEAAGTSIGNLYFYFSNKDDLLNALVTEARDRVWGWIDQVSALLPPGPARLAVAIYANAIGLLWSDRALTYMLFREAERPEMADRIAGLYQGRIRQAIQENVPDYPAADLDRAAVTWTGAGRYAVQRLVAGDLADDPLELARFVARWNLRGLGVPDGDIDQAIQMAQEAVKTAGLLKAGNPRA